MCLIETCKATEIFISYILAFFFVPVKRLEREWGRIRAKHVVLSKRYKIQPASCLSTWSQKHGSNSQEMHLIYVCTSKDRTPSLLLTGCELYGEQQLAVMTMGCCIGNAVSWNSSETHQRIGGFFIPVLPSCKQIHSKVTITCWFFCI